MTKNKVIPGSGVVLLSTNWNQAWLIPDSDIRYNEYCPDDPVTSEKCLTGCTNTAAGQLLYYWLENSDFRLTLQLTQEDNYTSKYDGKTITIDATAATAQKSGYLSFSKVNPHLSGFTVGDASDIAALCFACGIVQRAQYSSEATLTAWNKTLFYRAGMAGYTSIGGYDSYCDNPYFYTYSGENVRITDAGYEILINELLSGRPVATSYPGHALLWDGYDQENDKFHINFGWGGNKNGWYSRAEIYDMQFYQFCIDIMPEYDGAPILVTNSATYGVGTFLRGIEQLQGILNADTLTVQSDGSSIELQRAWEFDKEITINNFNSKVSFKQSSCGIKSSVNISLNGMSGVLHASRTDELYSATALESEGDILLTDFSGTISSTSKVYAAGINCCNLTITAMTGTILSRSTGGSVFAVTASKNVDIDKMEGVISAESGIYSCAAIQAGANISIKNLSGNLSATGTPGSANGIDAAGSVDITNFSGSIKVQSRQYAGCGIFGTGKICIKNSAGTIQAKSFSSNAYGIKSNSGIEVEDFSGSILCESGSYAAGISGDTLLFGNMTGTISAESGSGSVYAVTAIADITIDNMQGVLSAESGIYSCAAIQAGANVSIKNLSGNLSATGTPGSANGIDAAGSVDITNFSGSIKAQSSQYAGCGIFGTGKIHITNLSGTILANSLTSCAYGIKSQTALETENFSGVCIAATKGSTSPQTGAICSENGSLKMTLNDGRIYAGKYLSQASLNTMQQKLSAWGAAGVKNAIQYNSQVVSSSYAVFGSNQVDTILAKNHSSIQGNLYLQGGSDTLSIMEGSYVYAQNINSLEQLTIDNSSSIYGTFYGDTESSMTVNMIITGESSSAELIHLQNYVNNFTYFLKDETLNVNLQAASDGKYVLVNAQGLSNANYLSGLSAKITTNNGTFTLACGESSGAVSLKYEKEKLILVLDGYSQASEQALLFEDSQLLSINRSVSYKTLSSDSADSLRLVNGGSANHITISSGGDLSVSSDGFAKNTTVKSYGFLALNQGGHATNTTVRAYGWLNISAGATHEGALIIEEDAVVRAASTGTIDFSLDGFSAYSYQGINDFSRIEGTPYYTLTVSGNQSAGKYILAGNAAGFNQMITVNGLSESHQLDLSRQSSFDTDNRKYSLALNSENELELSILNKENPPVITLTGDNQTLLRSAELTASADKAADIYYNIDNGAWNLYTGVITVNANATYYFKATDDAGNTGYAQKSFNNIVTAPYDLQGDKEGISWSPVPETEYYEIEYSRDNFEHTIVIQTSGTGVDTLALPQGSYQWRVQADETTQKSTGKTITAEAVSGAEVLQSDNDQLGDLFFANASGIWEGRYFARHQGSDTWKGTGERVSLSGKNILDDFFIGSEDANILMLTDTENGDALFVDDIYTALPGTITEQQARLAQIDEIRAGTGADIIDLTSQRFSYTGTGMILRGGDGDDTIWANPGGNKLFGDAGDDRLVGASGDDIFAGGADNDSMQGGGGNDIFCFCKNWGTDTVEQLDGGIVTLWFAEESGTWDQSTMTYADGTNSVKVSGVSTVTLKFGDDSSAEYDSLISLGAFAANSTGKIFEEKNKGTVAVL